jgi:phenylalanyl-tRNA synthetase beta chain
MTPLWMQEKLRRCGVRSIHPVVDVTNYVLLELGQPMHAFDLDKLRGGVQVRYGRDNEKLTLLDGSEINVDKNTLVIADQQQAHALAGIMGGLDSAVSETTNALFLECAFFAPAAIAGRARQYGLHTDSSHRFERGVDPGMTHAAMARATELLLEIVGGQAGPVTETLDETCLPRRHDIELRGKRIQRILGHAIEPVYVDSILSRLGMSVTEIETGNWDVTPPSYRFDIEIEADLIEEVARVYGYHLLPVAAPLARLELGQRSEQQTDPARIRQVLVDRGYQEAITYSFIDPELQSRIDPGQPPIRLMNAIASDMAVMRTSLWPGLIKTLQYNQNRQQARVRLFETGATYHEENNERKETVTLGGVVVGPVWPEQWGNENREADYFDIKSDIEAILALTGAPVDFIFEAARHAALHPGQTARIVHRERGPVGWLGVLHPNLCRDLDIIGTPLLFELAMPALTVRKCPDYKELSRFPAIRRDIAIVVDQSVTAARVQSCIAAASGGLLQELQLFDVYQGKGIDSGRKSLALGLTLQDTVRTLTDQDVASVVETVLQELKTNLGASLRE